MDIFDAVQLDENQTVALRAREEKIKSMNKAAQISTIVVSANTSWNLATFRRPIIQRFIREGYKVIAVAPDEEFRVDLIKVGCEFRKIAFDNTSLSPIAGAKLTFDFFRLLRKIEEPICLNFTIKPVVFCTIACALLKIRCFNTITGVGSSFSKSVLLSFVVNNLYRLSLSRSSLVLFQNVDDANEFVDKGLVSRKIIDVVPGSGVDTNHYVALEIEKNRPVTFLFIGRILTDKGVSEFVQAAEKVAEEKDYPDVQFQIIGPTGYNNPNALTLADLELATSSGVVSYLGSFPDVRPFIERAACVVLPSYREGMPRVLMEALSMRRPIIASNVPGCRDLAREGETGYLCEPKSAQSLFMAMKKFLETSLEQKRRMGEIGRAYIKSNYHEDFVADKYFQAVQNWKA
jgi:glycosyltransferase involved in cell wall biosynthesis